MWLLLATFRAAHGFGWSGRIESGGALGRPRRARHALAGGVRDVSHDVGDAFAHFRGKACQQFGPLGDPVGSDPVVEPSASGRDVEEDGSGIAWVLRAPDIAFALEGCDDATRGALVEVQLRGKGVERGWPTSQESFQGIALGERDVVAANLVALAEEVGSDEVRERLVEGLDLPLKDRIRGLHSSWQSQLYPPMGWRVKPDGFRGVPHVSPDVRGRSYGELLVDHLAKHARANGGTLLRLETGIDQQTAIWLYKRLGLRCIPPFGPYTDDPLSRCYERSPAPG